MESVTLNVHFLLLIVQNVESWRKEGLTASLIQDFELFRLSIASLPFAFSKKEAVSKSVLRLIICISQ